MEKIEKVLEGRLEELKEDAELRRGKEYRLYYLRVGLAIVRDLHLREVGYDALGVFFVLASHMDSGREAYPTLRTIAYEAGCKIKVNRRGENYHSGMTKIRGLIRRLEEASWVKKVGRIRKPDGKFGAVIYKVLKDDLVRWVKEPSFLEKPVADSDTGGNTVTARNIG